MPGVLYRQLLSQAGRLARLDARRLKQGNLRRALSSGYYALFHFLIDQSTRNLIGVAPADTSLRHLVSRAYAHEEMASAAKSFRSGNLPSIVQRTYGAPMAIPPALRDVAALFVVAQERRHQADYDLAVKFVRSDVLAFVSRVEQAIANWPSVRSDPAARLFLVALLLWKRVKDR